MALPYIVGEYGGAAFVLLYLIFLVILGLPVMVMEFAVGRASQKSGALAYDVLEPNCRFRWFTWWGQIGCYVLLMFYTTVAGWMLAYIPKMASGELSTTDPDAIAATFSGMLADPAQLIGWMVVVVLIGFLVCRLGLQKGVERITKIMMAALFVIMIALCIRTVTLPGAGEGIAFYLIPDFGKLFAGNTPAEQWATFGQAVYAAMGQAFFSLSLGIAAMEIFGSYIGRERSLTGEAISVTALNTVVAILAGLIIFPACFAYGVTPDSGPSLVFVTLPAVFAEMPLGNVWGALFFVFMSFAALSTVIAVFENLVSWTMDKFGMWRSRAVTITAILLVLLSLPCALGFNVLSGISIPSIGDIQSIEDFVVSNNMLPLGALVFVLFCTQKFGWGWDNFLAEADQGKALNSPPGQNRGLNTASLCSSWPFSSWATRASLLKTSASNDPAYAGSFHISAQLPVYGRVTLLATTARCLFAPFVTALYDRPASFSFEMKCENELRWSLSVLCGKKMTAKHGHENRQICNGNSRPAPH